jgi:hypothetical protein
MYPQQQPMPQFNPERRTDYQFDMTEQYGSIIKELTDTEKLLADYELRLRGKMRDASGKIVDDNRGEPRINSDRAARDFVDIIRGVVNRHNDFSFYSENDAIAITNGANYTINRWLMLQAAEVPLRYRSKISFEAMALIFASVHKATEGKILKWTKGAFSEDMNRQGDARQKHSVMDYIPFLKKKQNYGG